MKSRMKVASLVALLCLSAFAFAGTQDAVATQGQGILAGRVNTETNETVVQNTNVSVANCDRSTNDGLEGCGTFGVEGFGNAAGVAGIGDTGVEGTGGPVGVYGDGSTYGLEGNSFSGTGIHGQTTAEGQNGVFGEAANNTGSGVYGQNEGLGFGVAGRATGTNGGTGVLGDAPNSANGVGVEADSAKGIALSVKGVASFSRSGTATITYPDDHVTISGVGVKASSMVLATAQNQIQGVWVQAAPHSSLFHTVTIDLNKAPGTANNPQSVTVAWFVLN